jgi:hypothetical protein
MSGARGGPDADEVALGSDRTVGLLATERCT